MENKQCYNCHIEAEWQEHYILAVRRFDKFMNKALAMPIGELLDTTDDTLAGAIYTAITAIYAKAPHATVVLITASQGQMNQAGTAGYPIDFGDGKQLKFNEMTVRMAHYLGCHVIDAGSKAQINNFHPEYLADHIHHSWAGGQQYADTIWEELKNIHPNTSNPYFEEEP